MEKEQDREIHHSHFCNRYEDSSSFLPIKYRNGTSVFNLFISCVTDMDGPTVFGMNLNI